nr:hypothetical protein [Tanacetum cinerariifolium]
VGNRLHMLERDMHDSWKRRMELYMMNRQHGRMILESLKMVHSSGLQYTARGLCIGVGNRLHMLERDMHDSWKRRMELYMMNRQHGRMILESLKMVHSSGLQLRKMV